MRALCVGRHQYLSEHLGAYFRRLGIETKVAVGLEDAARVARAERPQVIVADYELLASVPHGDWERDATLSRIPVVAVSLTRRPGEAHPIGLDGLAGFLYLPSLDAEGVVRTLQAAAGPVVLPSGAGPSWQIAASSSHRV